MTGNIETELSLGFNRIWPDKSTSIKTERGRHHKQNLISPLDAWSLIVHEGSRGYNNIHKILITAMSPIQGNKCGFEIENKSHSDFKTDKHRVQ